jgi:hypothetical protein
MLIFLFLIAIKANIKEMETIELQIAFSFGS